MIAIKLWNLRRIIIIGAEGPPLSPVEVPVRPPKPDIILPLFRFSPTAYQPPLLQGKTFSAFQELIGLLAAATHRFRCSLIAAVAATTLVMMSTAADSTLADR